jgi:hypothetical protein
MKPTEEYLLRIEERMKSLADELGLTIAECREVFARVSWIAQRLRGEAHEGCLALDALKASVRIEGPCPPGFLCVHTPKCKGSA